MELYDRSKKLAVPPEIWVALTVERPEMVKAYLDRLRANPDQADVVGLVELVGAMAEEILDLRDRLKEVSDIRRDMYANLAGVLNMTRRLEKEADFLNQRPHVYEPDPDSKREIERDEARDARRPESSGIREKLEAAFLAHVQGGGDMKTRPLLPIRLKKGTWVKVIGLKATDYNEAVQERRKEFVGCIGTVVQSHDSHGLSYTVLFPSAGHGSTFDHDEMEVLERGWCARCCDANPGPVGEPCPTCEDPLGPYHGA